MPQRMTLRATPKMLKAAGIEPEPPPPAPPPLPARPRKPDTADRAGKAAPSSRRPNRHETNLRITALLRRRFPEAFTEPRPLAVGIYREIRDVIGRDELSSRDLSAFMASWTRRPAYRAALERGERRVNLDGSDAGPAFTEPQAA